MNMYRIVGSISRLKYKIHAEDAPVSGNLDTSKSSMSQKFFKAKDRRVSQGILSANLLRH